MKRIFGILAPVIFFIATITTALCSDVTYNIPELYMTVTIPDDYTILTRGMDENDPRFAEVGIDADTWNSMCEQRSIYLNAVSKKTSEEIIITMVTSEEIQKAFNLKNASKKDMKDFLSTANDIFARFGATLENTSEYKHKQALFEVFDFYMTSGGITASCREYSTIINGQFIKITFNSYTGALTDSQKAVLKQVVDNTVFSEQANLSRIFLYAGSAILLGGVFGVIRYFRKKRRRQKDDGNPPKQPRPPYAQ